MVNNQTTINEQFYYDLKDKFNELYDGYADDIAETVLIAIDELTNDRSNEMLPEILSKMPTFFKEFISNEYKKRGIHYNSIESKFNNTDSVLDFLGI